jgi:uncharacterized protein YggT (Ycf19 family)
VLGRLAWALVAFLVAATAYELAIALGAGGGVGRLPGQGPPGSGAVDLAALLAMLAGAVLAPFRRSGLAVGLAAVAAALYAIAFEYTFDPYYAPVRRRFADGGAVAVGWMVALAVVAVLLAALRVRAPRQAGIALALFLVVVAVSVLFAGDGH